MSQPVQPSFYAIIPATVRYCKEIEPGAKLLYGELTALASQHGYCWASNKYLSDLYGVDLTTIKRWLRSLKDQKFISVEVETGGFQTDRKIWISPEIKRMFTKVQKCPGGDEIPLLPRGKNAPHINTYSNTSKEEREGAGPPASPPPTRTFFYKRVQIGMEKYNKLCDEFTTGKIQEMMERLDEYADINPKRFNQYRDHGTVIRKWIREDKQNPQGRVNRGLELARKLKAWVHTEKDTRIEFEAKGINFGYSPGSGSNFVAYDDPKSAEKIEIQCEKMGIFL